MDNNTTSKENIQSFPQEQEIDLLALGKNVWNSRKLILKVCGIGTIIGLIMGFSVPKEYTASTLIAPEGYRRGASSGMSALANIADIDISSSPTTDRDAIYPSLYPTIVNSTPFLIRLFDISVQARKDSIAMPLSLYLKEHQKSPWWNVVTSAPFKVIGWGMSMFSEKPEEIQTKDTIDPFRMTREEMGIANAIASRINIGVDKKKRTITIFVTMQDPMVAATVADTVRAHLKEYVTEYRTAKARRTLAYVENLRQEAQTEYYQAQKKYTQFADANQGLVKLTSRAELARLENEMNLAQAIYNQTEQQVQAAMTKVENVRPVYAIIQPVQVPLVPSKPRKMIIIMGCILLSGAGSIGWILFGKDFLRDIKKKWNTSAGR